MIVISSEMAELIGLCHRILVMRGGRIVGEVAGEAMTEHAIVVLATGVECERRRRRHERGGGTRRRSPRRGGASSIGAVAPFLALALMCALGALRQPALPQPRQSSPTCWRAAPSSPRSRSGETLVITGGGLDLSVGSMAALVAGLRSCSSTRG